MRDWIDTYLKGDKIIWSIVILLSVFSILVVYSATGTLAYKMANGNTEFYLLKHTFLVVLSLVAMWITHRIDYRYYSKICLMALWVSVPLLLYTWQFGVNINEASRWITIPVLNQAFQPSDLAKLALIVTLANMLSKKQHNIDDIKESLIPILLWCGTICGLIALTNVSTALLLFLTCMLIMFIGRVPLQYLAMLVIIGALAGSIAMLVGQRWETVISRVDIFIQGDEIPYQAEQSFIAIANGGITGKGPGNSDQRTFLPHSYSDFIYSVVIEEYGLIGGLFVIVLYLMLLFRGMRAVISSQSAYGGLLSAGLSFALVLQAIVNIGVAVGLLPITGLTLPLISMGGTSQLFTGIAIGIILSVSRQEFDEEQNQLEEVKNVAVAA
ncbi:MAG: FtsW/RodA/SpoVE family cell cycle protein [Bacteroidetes bacterium]|nr:FtsW/RodA/SpoVE family cell cycle protein [Bacteroidota bacterium]MDA1121086.1 FtsW/RodA/SpoVE family cell cycle protein [Bacteroidota bacterium]